MQVRFRLSAAALALAFVGPALSAQQTTPGDPLLHLQVVVTDSAGKRVSGLTQQEFSLLDNKSPRPLAAFREVNPSANTPPARVLIVVDAVNTPFSAVAYQRDQIEKFLRSNEGRLATPTSIAVLTDKGAQLFNGASTDGNVLADSLQHFDIGLREIGRSQGVYGAEDRVTISLNALRQMIAFEGKTPGRKLVLWVSPGWALLSGPGIDLTNKQQDQIYQNIVDFSTQMRNANLILYSINSWGAGESVGRALYYEQFLDGVTKPGQTQLGDLGLQVLAAQSGGLVLNSTDVKGMLQTCVEDAAPFYEVSFVPAAGDHPSEYHKLAIHLDRPGLTARTRQNYYAQP